MGQGLTSAITGWALKEAIALDGGAARGFLAELYQVSALKRQAAFAMLAAGSPPGDILGRLPGAPADLTQGLRTCRARDLVEAAYGCFVPTGFVRALARMGLRAPPHPDCYPRLLRLFTDEPYSARTNAIRYCGALNAAMILAVDALDPALIHPNIIGSVAHTDPSLVNAAFRLLCQATQGSNERMVEAFIRHGVGRGLRDAVAQAARRTQFPAPPFQGGSRLRPIRSAPDLFATGKSMQNCLAKGRYIGEVLLGFVYLYKGSFEDRTGDSYPVIAEIRAAANGFWTFSGAHGSRNVLLPDEVRRAVALECAAMGVIVEINPLKSEEDQQLARLLGVHALTIGALPHFATTDSLRKAA